MVRMSICDCYWVDRKKNKLGISVIEELKYHVYIEAQKYGRVVDVNNVVDKDKGMLDLYLYVHGVFNAEDVAWHIIDYAEKLAPHLTGDYGKTEKPTVATLDEQWRVW